MRALCQARNCTHVHTMKGCVLTERPFSQPLIAHYGFERWHMTHVIYASCSLEMDIYEVQQEFFVCVPKECATNHCLKCGERKAS